MPLTGTEHVALTSTLGVWTDGSTAAIAQLAANTPARTNQSLATAGNGTLTGAQIVAGMVTRTGPTAAFTDTTDSSANISAALASAVGAGNAPVSSEWKFFYRNTTLYPATIAAGSGIVLNGDSVVPANSVGLFSVQMTSASSFTVVGLGVFYDAGAGYEPSSMLTQFGGSTGSFLNDGSLNKQISSAGVNPGATGADNVLAVASIPASAFDGIGNREVEILAFGSFGATGNNKRVKIIVNPASAVVGSTVGAGGTTIADTGSVTTNAGGWKLHSSVAKYGALGSNTQIGFNWENAAGAYVQPLAPALVTAAESGAILVAVTGNATTAASDIVFNGLFVRAKN